MRWYLTRAILLLLSIGAFIIGSISKRQSHLRSSSLELVSPKEFVSISFNLTHHTTRQPSSTKPRITYTLRHHALHQDFFIPNLKCNSLLPSNTTLTNGRLGLQPEMSKPTGVLDFGTEISTSLKILVIGDSVGIQIAQTLEEAAGGIREKRTVYEVFRRYGNTNEVLHVTAPLPGGGAVAGLRITNILLRAGEFLSVPVSQPGGSWSRQNVERLLNHSYVEMGPTPPTYTETTNTTAINAAIPPMETPNMTMTAIQRLDVVVMRIPHGWIGLNNVTFDALHEAVELAYELFRARQLIFLTIHTTNNIYDLNDVALLDEKNRMIRSFTDDYKPSSSMAVQHVAYYDFGRLADELLEWNARLLGYNVDGNNKTYAMDFLKTPAHLQALRVHFKIPHLCARRVPTGSNDCLRNSISVDGIHPCMNTFAPRMMAGLACIIQCTEEDRQRAEGEDQSANVRECHKACNEQFATLKPVPVDLLRPL